MIESGRFKDAVAGGREILMERGRQRELFAAPGVKSHKIGKPDGVGVRLGAARLCAPRWLASVRQLRNREPDGSLDSFNSAVSVGRTT